jgi:hypothetical protein
MERTRRSQALNSILSMQTNLAREGMDEVLVNMDGFHHALIDYARAMDLPNPEKYFLDPMDESSIKARDLKSKSSARERDMQNRFLQQTIQLQQLETAFAKYKQDTDLQFKYWQQVLESEIKEAGIVGDATTQLLLKKMGLQDATKQKKTTIDSIGKSGDNEEGSPESTE